jgi:monoamine oxidase
VLIAGGGLCGLVALDRVIKSGRRAVLLEGSPRLGGRILTVRKGLSEGLRAEMGAERVGADHQNVRKLLTELGIETTPYLAPTQPFSFSWKGRVYRFREPRDLPADALNGLSDVERAAGPIGVLDALLDRATTPDVNDPRSAIEWLRTLGMTQRGEECVRAFVALPLDAMTAAAFHRTVARDLGARRSDTIAGGTDRLVEALAARHRDAITHDARIVSAAQTDTGVTLIDVHQRKFEGQSAIFALPLVRLRELRIEPGVPGPLADRLAGLDVARELKLAVEVVHKDTPVPPPEYLFCEEGPGVAWRLPETSAQHSFVLQGLGWLNEPKVDREQFEQLTRFWQVHPGAESIMHDFTDDPFIGGAYAFARSARPSEGVIRAGRLVFSGGDLSDLPGWMEGAVRAADQAVAALPG